jgi:hypothetical protein
MKINFPAQFRVKKGDGIIMYLCQKHMKRELQDEKANADQLPDDSNLGCAECSSERMNS